MACYMDKRLTDHDASMREIVYEVEAIWYMKDDLLST